MALKTQEAVQAGALSSERTVLSQLCSERGLRWAEERELMAERRTLLAHSSKVGLPWMPGAKSLLSVQRELLVAAKALSAKRAPLSPSAERAAT
jgi:hypothetical protein